MYCNRWSTNVKRPTMDSTQWHVTSWMVTSPHDDCVWIPGPVLWTWSIRMYNKENHRHRFGGPLNIWRKRADSGGALLPANVNRHRLLPWPLPLQQFHPWPSLTSCLLPLLKVILYGKSPPHPPHRWRLWTVLTPGLFHLKVRFEKPGQSIFSFPFVHVGRWRMYSVSNLKLSFYLCSLLTLFFRPHRRRKTSKSNSSVHISTNCLQTDSLLS